MIFHDEIRLVNFRFIEDRWNIINSVLAEYFGKEQFKKMKNDVGKMMYASIETDFEWMITSACKHVLHNAGIITKLDKTIERRRFYAHYIIS